MNEKGSVNMKIGFISLGCSKNLVDSEKLMGILKENNHEIVSKAADAEAIFINTCGFINPAKEEAIDTILEMAEYKNGNCKKLIVTGCFAKRYKQELIESMPEVDVFIGVDEYDRFTEIVSEVLETEIKGTYGKTDRVISTKPWMAYLKIAEGCSNCCTYCAIPLIRGEYRSFDMNDVLDEANRLASYGVKELVLIAQDTTRYGMDTHQKRMLIPLLEELNKIEGFHWIRILYMYPDEIDEELIIEMKKLDKVIPYFDIPVQHATDKMLKLMNRRGSVESILNLTKFIRKHYPYSVLRTTMIVGFPQETQEDFDAMVEFVKEVKWDRLGAFTYSKEEDTPAYDMESDITEEEKEKRLKALMDVQEKIAHQNSCDLIGHTLEVLIESKSAISNSYKGRSIYSAPDGIDGVVFVKSDTEIELGTFVNVKIDKAQDHDLYGKVI